MNATADEFAFFKPLNGTFIRGAMRSYSTRHKYFPAREFLVAL
jgi:hypothetical protein